MEGRASPGSTAALLAVLPQLQHLTSVTLCSMRLCVDGVPWHEVPALTGLSKLQEFKALGDVQWAPLLPLHALRHLFLAAGPQLQALTCLELTADLDMEYDPEWVSTGDEWCVDADDIDAVAASCPNLARLHLARVLQPDALYGTAIYSLLRLQQQLHLPSLSLEGTCVNDDTAGVLAQMTSLQYLCLESIREGEEAEDMWEHEATRFTERGLEKLTALKQLTRLEVSSCWFPKDLLPNSGDFLVIQAEPQVSGWVCAASLGWWVH